MLLERERVARFPGATGRIPNFAGAPATAARLAALAAWQVAGVVKANPDALRLPVRAHALADGKLLYMAVPRLANGRPFILLDPERLSVPPRRHPVLAARASAQRSSGDVPLFPGSSPCVNDRRVRGSGGNRTAIQGELHHGRGNPIDMPQFAVLTAGLVGVA